MEERARVEVALANLLAGNVPAPKEGQAAPTIIIQGDVHIADLRVHLGRAGCSDNERQPAA